jgi:hypothetical protein
LSATITTQLQPPYPFLKDRVNDVNSSIVKMHHDSLLMKFLPSWIAESSQRMNTTLNTECAVHSLPLWENNPRAIPDSVEKDHEQRFS